MKDHNSYNTSVFRLQSLAVFMTAAALAFALSACSTGEGGDSDESSLQDEQQETTNALTAAEEDEGWQLLFDGETLDEWTGLGRDTIPEGHWEVDDGTIRKVATGEVPTADDGQPLEGGDIMTRDTFSDYEFAFEWRVDRAANSGIKYNVSEELSTSHEPQHAALGFEYQVLDDDEHPDAEFPTHRAADLYDLLEADTTRKQLQPVGEWNESRLVFDGNRGEHWLNGEKVLEYELGTARMDSVLEASKYADIEGFGERRQNHHIVIQDHSDNVWFRNLKIRPISSPQQASAEVEE